MVTSCDRPHYITSHGFSGSVNEWAEIINEYTLALKRDLDLAHKRIDELIAENQKLVEHITRHEGAIARLEVKVEFVEIEQDRLTGKQTCP